MKNKISLTFLVVTLFSYSCLSQNETSDNGNSFWKKIKIRKAFETMDDKSEPAVFAISLPENKAKSFLINGGISFRMVTIRHDSNKSVKQVFSPFFIYNKNTEIDKEQNNYKLGASFNWKLGNLDMKARATRYFMWNNTLEYLHDKIDTSHSLIIVSNVSQINSKAGGKSFYINTYKDIGSGFQYFAAWSAGLEYQHVFDAKDADEEGGIMRGFYNVGFSLRKKIATDGGNAALGEPFAEIGISNTGRYDFINNTANREHYLPLIKAEIIIFPTLNEDLSISFSYNTGSDPIAGLPKQDFFLFAIKFKK